MKPKIAPTIEIILRRRWLPSKSDQAWRELRALLAVARAARLLAADPDVEGNDESAGYLDELNRALACLDRASERKP